MSAETTANNDDLITEDTETTTETSSQNMTESGKDNASDAGEIAALRAEIESLKQQVSEGQDAFLRARADYMNLKRRAEEERDSLRSYVTGDILTRLLPVIDNFERALVAAEQTKDYDKLIGGVDAVYRQLQTFLQKEGVQTIEALHQPFDPNLHNAVLRDEDSEEPENTVVEELQRGYRLGDRVLRATMVKVAVGK
jgi:molecular chaperone GrpE